MDDVRPGSGAGFADEVNCIGLDYSVHDRESEGAVPAEPVNCVKEHLFKLDLRGSRLRRAVRTTHFLAHGANERNFLMHSWNSEMNRRSFLRLAGVGIGAAAFG